MPGQKAILKQIERCKGCPLYNNQLPLLDKKTEADIFWVGLSAVKVTCTKKETPLAETTNSGQLIAQIEKRNSSAEFYKTNLVKCLPLEKGKIRYPNKKEMHACCKHLHNEITEFGPKLVFLLGKQVANFVTEKKDLRYPDNFEYALFQKGDTTYVPIHHPSYILVYKRKEINHYIDGISRVINGFLNQRRRPHQVVN